MPFVRTVAFAALAACIVVLTACTPTIPDDAPTGTTTPVAADPLSASDLASFSGVAMSNAGSNCTATVIETGVPSAPAYALTNGHCTGDVGRSAQKVTVDKEWWGSVEFFRTADNPSAARSVDVLALEYSTMRGRDLAVMRLDATLGQLTEYGVRPVKIRDSEPEPGTDVVNISVPVHDLPEPEWVMRHGECTLGQQHTIIEFAWLWFDAWSNDCPGIIAGASGSPLLTLDADGHAEEIVAMINTTSAGITAAAGGACAIHRPCQVTGDAVAMVEDTSYAVSVAGVGRCFTDDGLFGLGNDCPLEEATISANRGGGNFRGGDLPDSTGSVPEVSLVGAEASVVRTALIPLGDATGCTSPETYAGAVTAPLPVAEDMWADGHVLALDLHQEEGRYLLCAVAAEDYAGAASILFGVDNSSPRPRGGNG